MTEPTETACKNPKTEKLDAQVFSAVVLSALNANSEISQPSHSHRPLPQLTKLERENRPRWWTQSMLLHLVLRQASGKPMSRRELIPKALELDARIAKERGLPRLFGGKVFMNLNDKRHLNLLHHVF